MEQKVVVILTAKDLNQVKVGSQNEGRKNGGHC